MIVIVRSYNWMKTLMSVFSFVMIRLIFYTLVICEFFLNCENFYEQRYLKLRATDNKVWYDRSIKKHQQLFIVIVI